MKRYEKPAIELIGVKTEAILAALSNSPLPDNDNDYADIEDGVTLPDGMDWD